MKTLIEQIARSLVDKEADVSVNEVRTPGERVVLFEVSVADDEYGKLIGRNGEHVKAMRTLLNSVGRKHGISAVLEVNDPKHRKNREDKRARER